MLCASSSVLYSNRKVSIPRFFGKYSPLTKILDKR